MVLNRRKVLLSATVGAAGAVMTNTVSAKERNFLCSRVSIIQGYGSVSNFVSALNS